MQAMLFTLLCILCTSLLGILFKLTEGFNTRLPVIILLNYLTCFGIGLLWKGNQLITSFKVEFIPWIIGLALLFILGFNAYASTIRSAGLALATLFQKMSIILTVILAILWGEDFNFIQLVGWLLGLIAIGLAYLPDQDSIDSKRTLLKLVATLVLSSIIEISFLQLNKQLDLNEFIQEIFTSYLFLTASIFGLLSFYQVHRSFEIRKNELLFGIGIGLPNFFSIYFMMKAIQTEWQNVFFFPVLNCSVVVISALTGFYLFKDPLTKHQRLAIGLSLIAILLISLK